MGKESQSTDEPITIAEIDESASFEFDFPIRPVLRLGRIEQILRERQIIDPIPSRSSLIKWITIGKLEGHLTHVGWVVFKDSFFSWIKSITGVPQSDHAEK